MRPGHTGSEPQQALRDTSVSRGPCAPGNRHRVVRAAGTEVGTMHEITGLTNTEAAKRLAQDGFNELPRAGGAAASPSQRKWYASPCFSSLQPRAQSTAS